MKKFFTGVLVAFSLFSLNALTATVVSVKGKVEIQEAGMWVSLEKGDVLEKGTVISTGFNSEAVIKVSNSNVSLGPLTRVTIENLASTKEKDTTQLYIDSGTIAANVSGKDGKRAGFKVRSPVATASVRGTSFTLSSSGRLSVSEGLVAFGPSESKGAAVVEESLSVPAAKTEEKAISNVDSASENATQEHANAFASAEEVGGEGVPVAAGQSSVASVSGGLPSSPRAEMAKVSAGGMDNTVTLSKRNSIASGGSVSETVPANVSSGTNKPSKGSLNITVKVHD